MAVIADDNVRATRLRSGDLDGAILPQDLAATFRNDKVRRDHALAYASDAKKAGIDVTVESTTWEVIEPRRTDDAVLAGFGRTGEPDFGLYTLLRSSSEGHSGALETSDVGCSS